jgi:hypothetical protein
MLKPKEQSQLPPHSQDDILVSLLVNYFIAASQELEYLGSFLLSIQLIQHEVCLRSQEHSHELKLKSVTLIKFLFFFILLLPILAGLGYLNPK